MRYFELSANQELVIDTPEGRVTVRAGRRKAHADQASVKIDAPAGMWVTRRDADATPDETSPLPLPTTADARAVRLAAGRAG